jgi:prepilin-type N-terminal cleavage/methylation domain-containing protein
MQSVPHRSQRIGLRGRACASGFTLVELMAVVAVIGVLISLLLAAVQATRELARKAGCGNNLREQLFALQEFQAAHNRFPAGRQMTNVGEYSWCLETLPVLEQTALYARFDRTRPWMDPANHTVAGANLRVFRCPSALKKFDGKTDYGGITGSSITVTTGFDFSNGVLIEIGRLRRDFLTEAEIVDGTSQTILIAEAADGDENAGGRWISGYNCFSHDNGPINGPLGGDIFSRHPAGAFVGLADGSVKFLSQDTAVFVVGALCTRNGGESVNGF